MGTEIFADIKELVAEKTYKSKFDFEKYGIPEKDRKFIIQREEIILENAKKHAQSLYEMCKAIYEIRLTLKGDESQSFREWYTINGLTKDKVSELTKRYELYIQAPDKIDFITRLSIPAVKELTKKSTDLDVQIEAIEKGLNNVEDIKEFISTKTVSETTAKPKKIVAPKHIEKFIYFYEKNINASKDLKELATYKKDLADIEKYIKYMKKKIEEIEDERANENNLQLYGNDIEDAEIVTEKKVFMSEDNKIYTVQKKKEVNEFVIVELLSENDTDGKQVGTEWWYCEDVAVKVLEEKAQKNKWVAV